ncbi:cytochrome P450 [Kitasatospora sp. NPDC093558]|uniref:cytochrome P450 n=1 Tax=Kitasatospora sp. NPDC093558 TaxID=3155201 RepID=UPI00344220EF
MTTTAVSPALLTDPDLHAHGDPHAVWQWMRAHSPVHRHEAADLPAFWSLTRHEDIRSVYRDAAAFSSARGVLLRCGDDPGGGMTLALTDAPRHKQLRGLMADWFNTRAVRGLEGYIRTATRSVLGRALDLGSCDFADDVAGRLSLSVICHILGIPERDHEDLYRWTNEEFEAHTSLVSHPMLVEYFMELLYRRMEEPADDLVSALVNGTVDGELLTEEEAVLNCENLIGATENGRLALIGGMQAFLEHPDQWQRLTADRALMPGAIEEVLRWTSSATHSMRVATRCVEIRGTRVEAGDRVVLWLPSANRDEDLFTAAHRFDVTRSPNRHIALAAGEHFCIGSTLARAEMRILFTELMDTVGRIEQSGPARRLKSIEVNGPQTLPVRLGAK